MSFIALTTFVHVYSVCRGYYCINIITSHRLKKFFCFVLRTMSSLYSCSVNFTVIHWKIEFSKLKAPIFMLCAFNRMLNKRDHPSFSFQSAKTKVFECWMRETTPLLTFRVLRLKKLTECSVRETTPLLTSRVLRLK